MTTWNLNDIYRPADRNKLIAKLKLKVGEFKGFKPRLTNKISSAEFIKILKKSEELVEISARLSGYAGLSQCEDTSDSKRNADLAVISELCANVSNDVLFFSLWFKNLDDKTAKKLISASGKYRYYLERVRAYKKFTLKEKEEQIITLKDLTGNQSLVLLYDVFTNAFMYKYKGKLMTQEEINQFKQDHDRKKRVASYDLVLGRYGKEQHVLGEMYKAIVNDWRNEHLTLRGFKSPISVRNYANDIPDAAVEALLNVVRKNVGLFQEYFMIKSRIIKLKKMDRYDLYAPYDEFEKDYDYQQSKKIILETYREFSEDAYLMAKKMFDENHVHAFPKKGKRFGAFCWTVLRNITPYILLNHVGKIKDVFTMVHEFGHGIHSIAASNQTQFTFHSSLPLAETASIFGEMLLSQKLLKKAGAEEKVAILLRNLDGQYASITRQAYFVLFEIASHDAIAKGATVEQLNKLYLENLNEQFGTVHVPDVFQHEWTYIPHIYNTPFYCYAYAFGNLLVLALYRMYQEQGKSFVSKYLKLLSYGGSEAIEKILKELGIDIADEGFWQQGFDIIREELEELKRLTK